MPWPTRINLSPEDPGVSPPPSGGEEARGQAGLGFLVPSSREGQPLARRILDGLNDQENQKSRHPEERCRSKIGCEKRVSRILSQFVPAVLPPIDHDTRDDENDNNPDTGIEENTTEIDTLTDLVPQGVCIGQSLVCLVQAVSSL